MVRSVFFAMALGLGAALFAQSAQSAEIVSSVDAARLDTKKQTPLGLYLTPADAHKALSSNPGIVFIDVRDPIEISFVGHAEGMDANVPVATATHELDPNKGAYTMAPNRNFVAEVDDAVARAGADKSTPVFVMCRSGARSADAAKMLIGAGYKSVWNLVEGFEGDKNEAGQRAVNGWRNAGLPWSYKIPAEAAWRPATTN